MKTSREDKLFFLFSFVFCLNIRDFITHALKFESFGFDEKWNYLSNYPKNKCTYPMIMTDHDRPLHWLRHQRVSKRYCGPTQLPRLTHICAKSLARNWCVKTAQLYMLLTWSRSPPACQSLQTKKPKRRTRYHRHLPATSALTSMQSRAIAFLKQVTNQPMTRIGDRVTKGGDDLKEMWRGRITTVQLL